MTSPTSAGLSHPANKLSHPGHQKRGALRVRLIVLLLVAATAVVFGRLCTHEFALWDDADTLYENKNLTPPRLENFAHYWHPLRPHMGLWVPMTYTVWEGLAFIAHTQQPDDDGSWLNPWIYHSANVAVHILTALVAFALLRLLVGSDWPAAIGALLYAIHPVQVETVAWASGMKDLLCGLFTLTAVWQYVLYARGTPHRRVHYAIGMAAMVLGILSKPTAVMAPLLAAIIDYLIVGRSAKTVIRSLWPWFVLVLPFALFARIVQTVPDLPNAPLWARPILAGFSLAFYLLTLVLPAHLALDYGYAPPVVLEQSWAYIAWVLPAAIAGWLWWRRRQYPVLAAAGLLFVAGMLPVLGLTRFQFQFYSTVADHYLYLPMLGPALALAWVLHRWPSRVLISVCVLVLLGFAVRSVLQGAHWKDSPTLFAHTLRVNPRSFAAHNNMAAHYAKRNRIVEATGHTVAALAIVDSMPEGMDKDTFPAHGAMGQTLVLLGRPAEAIPHFEYQLRVKPNDPEIIKKLNDARVKAGLAPLPAVPASAPADQASATPAPATMPTTVQ